MELNELKKARAGIRRKVTTTLQALEGFLVAEPLDLERINARRRLLQEDSAKLKNLDDQIYAKIIAEDNNEDVDYDGDAADAAIDLELKGADDYQEKIEIIMSKVHQKLLPVRPGSPTLSEYSTAVGDGEKKKQYKLPKIQLKKFNGNLSEWLGWWSQFSKIHDDADLHEVDKFMYLSQSVVSGTRAKELVDSYPMTAANYPEVVQALKDRFGQEDLLIPHYIRGLLKIVIQNATNKEKVVLSSLYDKVETDVRALGTLKVTTQEMGRFLHPIVESCLSEEVFVAWQRSPFYEKDGSAENPPKSKLDYLLQFLKAESQREMKREQAKEDFNWDAVSFKKQDPNKAKKVRKSSEDFPTNAGLLSQNAKLDCIFCDKNNHQSCRCYKGKDMTLEDKKWQVRAKQACFICLLPGHRSNKCQADVKCQKCTKRHYEIMCPGSATGEASHSSRETTSSSLGIQCQGNILLKTIVVKVKLDNSPEYRLVRVLFDDGSQRSYATSRTVQDIGSQPFGKEESRIVLMNGSVTDYENTNKHEVVVLGMHPSSKPVKIIVREKPVIGCVTPRIPNGPWISQLKKRKIFLSDWEMAFTERPEIQILIGSDYYEKFRTGKRIQLQPGLFAVETILGWTLSGPIGGEESAAMDVTHSYFSAELSKLWDLELLGIRDTADQETKQEKDLRVKEGFLNQIQRNPDGRYVVKLPWISGVPSIPDNRKIAEKRLVAATKKLITQGEFDKYDQIFKDWMAEGIIEEMVDDPGNGGHYIPHRPVFKPDSLTTPVRPVYDASCRVGKHPSLNMCLETGPNMLDLIPSMLLRFRRYPVGALADIRKAFQMVQVAVEDRKFQKFLWWKDVEKNIFKVYRHCRVVFGMTCSPFILMAVLEYHLKSVPEEDRELAELLFKSLYVDNVITSFSQEKEYHTFKSKSTELLADAGMDLRQWESNIDFDENLDVDGNTNALGLVWDKKPDCLRCKLPKSAEDPINEVTSRKVLSLVAQIFDPIGFLCPSTLLPKMMLQKAWIKEKKWDEAWDEGETAEFRIWVEELAMVSKIQIPRFAFRPFGCAGQEEEGFQLHLFCDASNGGYAAVAFIRIENDSGVEIQFLMARSRVSPLEKKKKSKKVTIPRLELLACVIGARLKLGICEALDLSDVSIHLWSDSTTALAWIERDEDWGTFVGNRAREINKLTDKDSWKHVPGCMNPADLPSRGCGFSSLYETKWWEGPHWLRLSKEDWPNPNENEFDEDLINSEKRKTIVCALAVERIEPKFSHYMKNVRVAAWMRRIITFCLTKERSKMKFCPFLTLTEIRQGERDVLYGIQRRHFGNQPDVKGFGVIKMSDGLWHLKSRLTNRDDTESFKYPVLLPKNEPLVEQLVRYIHQSSYHSGTQHVLGRIREHYWIIHSRSLVKSIIHKCVKCQRYRVGKMKCDPASLPEKRIETVAAFQNTGVDLAGPLMIKGGKKYWIVLYTCAVYRGIYLDLVDSLSTEAFFMSLERFVNTMGRPNTVYSDNGTNFVGSSNLMKKLDFGKMTKEFGTKRINWIFNPPSAPWWGGWWERLVRSTKEILRKMMGKSKLTYDELRTCLAAVSQVINDRPLCAMTADVDDLRPLTPSIFMRDLPVTIFPEGGVAGVKFLQGSYHVMQVMKASLQARFRKEYLGFLTSKNCDDENQAPKEGDLVLVGDTNKKRFEWPLGRITKLIPGKDGKIRVVMVKTSTGVFTRPLQRLHPLEIPGKEECAISKVKVEEHAAAEEKLPEPEQVTRSGRIVKKPVRYGQWPN